jgi:hypothetical protein
MDYPVQVFAVDVNGVSYEIKFKCLSTHAWRAWGPFNGKQIESRGSTQSEAISSWKYQAESRDDYK